MEATLNFGWDGPLGPRQQNFTRPFGFGRPDRDDEGAPTRRGPRTRGRGRGPAAQQANGQPNEDRPGAASYGRPDERARGRGRGPWGGGALFADQPEGGHRGEGRGRRGGHGRGRGGRGPGFGREFADFADDFRRGGPPPFGGRGRARRGDVRMAALLLIAEQPRNGYQIISELAERTDGAWKPSPGAVYPALNQLEDEGLIAPTTAEGRKAFEITAAGREEVARVADRPTPWEQATGDRPTAQVQVMAAMRDLGMAVHAVASSGDEELSAKAAAQLEQTKKALYALLAEH